MTVPVIIIIIAVILLTITFIWGEFEKLDTYSCPECGSFMDEVADDGEQACWRCNG